KNVATGTPNRGVAANRLGKMSQRDQFLRIFCANATVGRHSCFRAPYAVPDARHSEKAAHGARPFSCRSRRSGDG
ncbi:hypothetical protein M3665_23700, partial [Bacillus licheniformis]|nr:hypothetical protein [Bacillus licheniformis]